MIKQAVDVGMDVPLADALHHERNLFEQVFRTADSQIGVRSFLEHGPERPSSPVLDGLRRPGDEAHLHRADQVAMMWNGTHRDSVRTGLAHQVCALEGAGARRHQRHGRWGRR